MDDKIINIKREINQERNTANADDKVWLKGYKDGLWMAMKLIDMLEKKQ